MRDHNPEWDSDYSEPERPHCPRCGMRMITTTEQSARMFECLRCGYTERLSDV